VSAARATDATPSTDAAEALARLRTEVERVDARLIALIAERTRLAVEIGAAKRTLGHPTLDPVREAAVVRRAVELARAAGLADEEGVRAIVWQLMALARRAQA
jgi:chorismate mutase